MIYNFTFLEKILLRASVIPHPVFDSLINVVAGRALQSAVELDIFNFISQKEGSTIEEIVTHTQANQNGVAVLLRCLVSLGYLQEKKDSVFILTKRGNFFFGKNINTSMHNMIKFADIHFRKLQDLTTNIKRGGPPKNVEAFSNQEEWDMFTGAMLEMAQSQAPELAKRIPIKNKRFRSLLDLGGSHGLYAIEICKRIPLMKAVVLDLPPVKPWAERIIRQHGMSDKIRFRSADFLKDDLNGPFDVILAGNIIHGLNLEENKLLTTHAWRALNSGGLYIIVDQIKDVEGNSELSHLFASSMGVMLFNIVGGQTYAFNEVKSWLENVGFKSVKLKRMRAPGFAIIIAEKL